MAASQGDSDAVLEETASRSNIASKEARSRSCLVKLPNGREEIYCLLEKNMAIEILTHIVRVRGHVTDLVLAFTRPVERLALASYGLARHGS